MRPLIIGLALTVVAAFCSGGQGLLLRLQRRYAWENTWILGQLAMMIILPLVTVEILVSGWFPAITVVSTSTIAIAVVFGFMWGAGSVAFAIGIEAVGVSLGFAVIMGVVTSVGSLTPMVRRWATVPAEVKAIVLLGIIVCLVGVALYGKAGMLREQDAQAGSSSAKTGVPASKERSTRALAIGLAWCVISGVLSAGCNIGFDFAAPISAELRRLGTNPQLASLVQWLPEFWGGYLAVLVFSVSAMLKNGTLKNFTKEGTGYDFIRAISLGTLSFLGVVFYGMAASSLGDLGTTVGYAIFLSLSIAVALLFGFALGEWRGAPKRSLVTLYSGLSVLVTSVVILAYANSLAS